MAITFDTTNKIIQLDRFVVSDRDIWTAYINWSVLSDNIKYGEIMSQIGGVAPVALYIYLENSWKVRPQEMNGITTITGNLLTSDGSSPVSQTIGNWNTLVKMETPVAAQAIPVGSGVTTQDKIDIVNNIWNNSNRTLTTGVVSTSSSSVDETQFHQWLDSYINKANWKADLSVVPTKYENADAVWSKVL